MESEKIFIVAGGDLRQLYLARRLSDFYKVIITGFDKCSDASDVLLSETDDNIADGIIFPLPVSLDGKNLNAPFSDKTLLISDFIAKLKKNSAVYGGMFSSEISDIFSVPIYDYSEREEFSVINAEATAEGALQTALEKSDETIFKSRILITGFGRIAKALARILLVMGADVTVSARKKSDIAWAEIYGCKAADIRRLADIAGSYDIIFNTVPVLIFDKNVLDNISKKTMIIDLASKPGGTDFGYAAELGIRAVLASGLPGKLFPVTAGYTAADALINMIDERRTGFD